MKFKTEDFEGLLIPVYGIDEKEDLLKNKLCSKLLEYKEVFDIKLPKLGINKVLRYIIYLYDINSPFHSVEVTGGRRKGEAAKLAGFEMDKTTKKYSDEVINMMVGKNEKINRMIIKYCLFFYIPRYAKLSVLLDAYEKTLKLLQIADEKEAKTKDILANLNTMEKEMDSIMEEIFASDGSQELNRTMYRMIEEEDLELSPELITKRIGEGKNSVDINPYKTRKYV